MLVKDAIKGLRKQFNRLRDGETFLNLEEAIDVPRARLSVFASGGMLRVADLEKIEDWCEKQAKKRGTHDHS
jgi:hypothetical protein